MKPEFVLPPEGAQTYVVHRPPTPKAVIALTSVRSDNSFYETTIALYERPNWFRRACLRFFLGWTVRDLD